MKNLLIYPAICFFLMSNCTPPKPSQKDPKLLNVVLIMGDDIGFSDIGCYGSEIPTPTLDRLASEGLRFRQFYNMSKCETTRSVLLTGHYTGNAQSVSMEHVMRNAGYYTIHSGKEHFKTWVPASEYAAQACDQSYTFWAANEFMIPPDSVFTRPFILNGHELTAKELYYHGDQFYKTDAFTDFAIDKLKARRDQEQPFFLYLPYGAAHYPLQARPEDIAKFRGKYKIGWDSVRQRRYEKMIRLGILDAKYKLSPPSSNINHFRGHPKGDEDIRKKIPLYRPWNSLSEQEKDDLDLEMAVFAAMVNRMDYNIGRVVSYLEQTGQMDNTLIMFLSDNGSCPYDSNRDFDHAPGDPAGFRTLSAAWANVGNTPFRYFKQFGHEGGAHTHFIAYWKDKIAPGQITNQPAHLVDIFPTILDATGIKYPVTVRGKTALPLHGHSMLPIFQGKQRKEPDYFVSGFQKRFRMWRQGNWKIVRANGEDWQLYNLTDDMTELNDLATQQPSLVDSLAHNLQQWEAALPGGKAQF